MKTIEKPPIQRKIRTSPLDIFFKLGDRVTKGDPYKKMEFDYYFLWVIFLAFFGVFIGNLRIFILSLDFSNLASASWQHLGWSLFGLAIMWFQYFNLKNFYNMRKIQKNIKVKQEPDENKIEGVDEMLAGFSNKDSK